jgi:hypothetical protein
MQWLISFLIKQCKLSMVLFQIIFEHMSANFHPLVLFIKRGHKRHPVTETFSFLLVFAFMQIFYFLRWRRRSCNTNFEQGQKKTNRKSQFQLPTLNGGNRVTKNNYQWLLFVGFLWMRFATTWRPKHYFEFLNSTCMSKLII